MSRRKLNVIAAGVRYLFVYSRTYTTNRRVPYSLAYAGKYDNERTRVDRIDSARARACVAALRYVNYAYAILLYRRVNVVGGDGSFVIPLRRYRRQMSFYRPICESGKRRREIAPVVVTIIITHLSRAPVRFTGCSGIRRHGRRARRVGQRPINVCPRFPDAEIVIAPASSERVSARSVDRDHGYAFRITRPFPISSR